MDRRQFLWISGVAMAGLAGCNSQNPSEAETTTSDTETTTTSTPANEPGEIQLEVNNREIQLPPIWSGHSIDDVSARVNAKVSDPDGLQSVILRSGDETIREFDSWENGAEKQFSLKPGEIPVEGGLSLVAQDSAGDTFSEELDVAKAVPSAFKIDVVPRKNQELRTQAHESEGENYLVRQTPLDSEDGLITDDLVFNYSSHEDLAFDKLPVDLAGMEYWHDNDYRNTKASETNDFLAILGNEGAAQDIKDVREDWPAGLTRFYGEDNEEKVFQYEEFANADTVDEAMDWIQPLLFNWHSVYTPAGPNSTEDFRQATTYQEAFDKHTHLDTHVWSFKIGINAEHGNGLIWDATNDELHVMEVAQDLMGGQLHPTVKESNYMKGDSHWHPLRFGLEAQEAEQYGWEPDRWPDRETFKHKKLRVADMLTGMVTIGDDLENSIWNAIPTTGYAESLAQKLRNYDSNDFNFEQLHNQAKVYPALSNKDDNFVVYGNVDNPQYAKIGGETLEASNANVIDTLGTRIWTDMDGEYDDFDQYIEENASYEEVNQGLGTAG